jgi:hypothetical protein
MFIFLLIYIISFIVSLREILKGNAQGILIFMIFGLSMYYTAMSVAFTLGLKDLIPIFQAFKEVLILCLLILNIVTLKYRPRLHLIDYAIFAYFLYLVAYAILPIGEQSFAERLVALKSNSIYIVVYFTARLMDPQKIYIGKYFNFIILLTIAVGLVLIGELLVGSQLQNFTGFADYSYYFFNFEPGGHFGLNWTFESDGGTPRFASFFTSPLEHAVATLLALSVIAGLYTSDDNKLTINNMGLLALGSTILSIIFAISRAPLISYFLVIYVYALITKRKFITRTIHAAVGLVVIYFIYLFAKFEQTNNGLLEVAMNTVDFSDPSSFGHLLQWAEGVLAIIEHPLGLGLGSSGRIGGSLGENVGGENQFIIIGVQAGIIALFLYLCIYLMFIKIGLKWLNKLKGRERKLCMAVLLLKISFLIPLMTSEVESSSYISYMNWFLSGLLISVIMRTETNQILLLNDH